MGRSYVRFAADRKTIFLKILAQTGLVTASCQRAGVHRDTVYAHRRSDDGFAEQWRSAVACYERQQAERLAGHAALVERLFQPEPPLEARS